MGGLWVHQVGRSWSLARKTCLTASDAVGLLPSVRKAGSTGTPIPAFFELIAEKRSAMEPELMSYDAAARGHELEPYAIEEYNMQPDEGRCQTFYHWDDVLIKNGGIGFSPDAMDIMHMNMPDACYEFKGGMLVGTSGRMQSVMPTSIMEIKSYSDRVHVKTLLTEDGKLKERYQVAFAMMVMPSIREACLCFYDPSCPIGMFTKWFDQADLVGEMQELYQVVDLWEKQNELFDQMALADEFDGRSIKHTTIDEWMIIQQVKEGMR